VTGSTPIGGDIGFVALWEKTPAEYVANREDEWGTTARIQDAFAKGRERGNLTYGLFDVRWSSAFAYMTFWRSPSVAAVTSTIRDLEEAGDFKFADSLHVLGQRVESSPFFAEDHVDDLPTVAVDGRAPVGLWVRWNGRDDRPTDWSSDRDLKDALAGHNVRLLGEYESRWLSRGGRFCFLVTPDVSAAAAVGQALRLAADRRGSDIEVVLGVLEEFYRFATHLQTDFPWLTKEHA
jgi:hypothetical protein